MSGNRVNVHAASSKLSAAFPELSAAFWVASGDRVHLSFTPPELSAAFRVGSGDRVDVSCVVAIAAPTTPLKTSSVLKLLSTLRSQIAQTLQSIVILTEQGEELFTSQTHTIKLQARFDQQMIRGKGAALKSSKVVQLIRLIRLVWRCRIEV